MKFNLAVEMKDRCVPYFMSMLKYMEYCGRIGISREVSLYADGDGDFQPKFEADIKYETVNPKEDCNGNRFYDAG